jgi:hypothetical protein
MADSALGRPWPQNGLAPDPAVAATLLIVRELMHHLNVDVLHP